MLLLLTDTADGQLVIIFVDWELHSGPYKEIFRIYFLYVKMNNMMHIANFETVPYLTSGTLINLHSVLKWI